MVVMAAMDLGGNVCFSRLGCWETRPVSPLSGRIWSRAIPSFLYTSFSILLSLSSVLPSRGHRSVSSLLFYCAKGSFSIPFVFVLVDAFFVFFCMWACNWHAQVGSTLTFCSSLSSLAYPDAGPTSSGPTRRRTACSATSSRWEQFSGWGGEYVYFYP